MKKDMPLEGLRWSRDSGSALYDTPQNGRSRTGWGGVFLSFGPRIAMPTALWSATPSQYIGDR